ncbi:MAG: DUF2092 domain-containing protein [Planctomycetales bacterium]|nr:DUF2092 domain-containing protein [Planctomycetales bacterium]
MLTQTRSVADELATGEPSAKQIIERMAKVYSECKSYRDSGVVKMSLEREGRKTTAEGSFTTAFVRPDRFLFDYQEQRRTRNFHFIVWSQGKEVKKYDNTEKGVQASDHLDNAINDVRGLSRWSAHTVPALLLPDKVSGLVLTDLTDLKRTEDGKVGMAECFRIEGKLGKDLPIATYRVLPMTLWIDKNSYLLRRVNRPERAEGWTSEETTTYDPVIDGKVEAAMLKFEPPINK